MAASICLCTSSLTRSFILAIESIFEEKNIPIGELERHIKAKGSNDTKRYDR
jgi:hypothetical protein